MASHECGHRRFPTNMPLADALPAPGPPEGAPANGGGRCCGWPGGATRPQRGVVAAGQRALCLAGFRFELSKP
jgi:hypothetical protein